MSFRINKRPSRQPLSPEEVLNFIRLKKFHKQRTIERFKKTQRYKMLNAFNVLCIVIYTELIIAFLGICNYGAHYIKTADHFYSLETSHGKKVCSSVVLNTVDNQIYDVSIHDTITPPRSEDHSRFLVGKDWILQKEVTVRFKGINASYIIKDSFPLLFISCLLGITTFISFGFNLNQVKYSLMATSLMNAMSLFSFLLL